MWSMCSMSTGHSFTQAPQLVHDQITSGSITPFASALPTRGRSASFCTSSGNAALASSDPASRYGALANAWSRRSRMSIFGDSGLPVTHAGHCDWQRPHSVQVPRSSMPFQVRSSILPRPKMSVSGSASSKSSTLPFERIGWRSRRPFGPPREQHVQRRERDVQVLGVGDEHAEPEDHGQLQQDERGLDRHVRAAAERRQPVPDDLRGERAVRL